MQTKFINNYKNRTDIPDGEGRDCYDYTGAVGADEEVTNLENFWPMDNNLSVIFVLYRF